MILLDTNVASEPTKPYPDPRVMAWLDQQSLETLHLPATALAELLVGVAQLPHGKKRDGLESIVRRLVDTLFGARVLPFDRDAAESYSVLSASARRRGKIVSLGDSQIGAIAFVHGLTVATRDTAPFIAMMIPVINPWDENPKEIAPSLHDAESTRGTDNLESTSDSE